MLINISRGIKNRYQLLTKRRPKSECNTTVATMGCIYTGHRIPAPDGVMPEDYLMDILDSPEGRAYLQKVCPGAKYNPWNDSHCIAWAVNKAVGKEACRVQKATMPEMIDHIRHGGAVGIGGGFLSGGTSGHFVCVVGVEYSNDTSVKSIIIDDPYGDYNEGYVDHFDGNDIPIKYADFVRLTFGRANTKTMQFYLRAA
jgi:hypothetical protein